MQMLSSDLSSLAHPANARSALYAALTAAFLGLSASQIIAPEATLTRIIQGANTPNCITLWQNAGAAFLTLPAWTIALKARAALCAICNAQGLCVT